LVNLGSHEKFSRITCVCKRDSDSDGGSITSQTTHAKELALILCLADPSSELVDWDRARLFSPVAFSPSLTALSSSWLTSPPPVDSPGATLSLMRWKLSRTRI
jgi:hypothetical protein